MAWREVPTYETREEKSIILRCDYRCLDSEFAGSIVGAIDGPISLFNDASTIFAAHKHCTNSYP